LNECLACGDLGDLPLAHFNFAFALFLRGDFESADWELQSALGIAERNGDLTSIARCLTYLTTNARRRGRPEDVVHYLPRARAIAEATSMREYKGVVCAHEAWLRWRAGDLAGAVSSADDALATWAPLAFCYAFQWTALWVLLDAHHSSERNDAAHAVAAALIDTSQQRLPVDLDEALSTAVSAGTNREIPVQRTHLRRALSLAREHHFL